MRRLLALGVVVLAMLLLIPASGVAGNICPQLRSRLVAGGGQASGLYVIDATSGTPVCGRAAKRRRPLASNMKLFTTSTALVRFSPQFRISTDLLTDGTLDPNGVLHGNLYLRGSGDPALGSPAFYDRFLGGMGTDLFELNTQLHEAGIRVVTGRLYADDTVFDRLRGVADSGYATSPYIGPLSGLSFNSGYSTSGGGAFASDPATVAATKLNDAMRRSGIAIRPGVALGTTPATAETVAQVTSPTMSQLVEATDIVGEVSWVTSPTMSQLVEATDVYSNNFFAEMLMKLIGATFGGGGTTRDGAIVVQHFARDHGSAVHAVDGSGLTRTNRASPLEVVRLLQAMRGTTVSGEFTDDLALAGHEGTVALRMHGTAADGRCRTKTGTLTGVSNLSGYCFARDGKLMIFSILMGSVSDLTLAHYEQDKIAAAIAAY